MNAEEKAPFEERAKEDKGRYDREMKLHKPVRDPNKPKKPQSAYFLFLARFREEMKESGMSHRDILKHAGERWNQMNEEEKHPFQVDAERGKRVYDQQMIEFNQKRMQQQQAERRAAEASASASNVNRQQVCYFFFFYISSRDFLLFALFNVKDICLILSIMLNISFFPLHIPILIIFLRFLKIVTT